MKFFRFLLLFPVLFISSCGNTYYTEEVFINTKTVYYDIYSRDWKPSLNWDYFYYDFQEPLLTNKIFDRGMMNAYLLPDSRNKSIISPLPFDDFYIQDDNIWTEQVTCEFSPQNIRFILKYNDFNARREPLDYTFMVRLAW